MPHCPRAVEAQYTDPESGLPYLRARYYDVSTGQFMSVDPVVAQTRSRYGYVDDNPLNGTDPTRLSVDLPGGICVRSVGEFFSGDNSHCNSVAHQHPALVPAIAATAAVAIALPVIAVGAASAGAAIAGAAIGGALATTAAVSGTTAAVGQAGVFLVAGGFLASAAAIPIGIAIDMYQRSHGCPGPGSAGNRLLETGLAGSGLGGPSDPMFPEPPSPVTPLPMFPLQPAFP